MPGFRDYKQQYYVDGLAFWKTRFYRSEQENTCLRGEIAVLTKELHARNSSGEQDQHKRSKKRVAPQTLDDLLTLHLVDLSAMLDAKCKFCYRSFESWTHELI